MTSLNHLLERTIAEADGRYLDTQELYPLEQYVQSYTTRLHTYQFLRDNGDKLVIYALRKLAQAYPDLVQQHGQRCKYDMTEVLRYMAVAILRDDETLFKEQMIAWLDTILLAYKRTAHCVVAYRHLQEAIAASLPPQDASLTRPYIEIVTQALQAHA